MKPEVEATFRAGGVGLTVDLLRDFIATLAQLCAWQERYCITHAPNASAIERVSQFMRYFDYCRAEKRDCVGRIVADACKPPLPIHSPHKPTLMKTVHSVHSRFGQDHAVSSQVT